MLTCANQTKSLGITFLLNSSCFIQNHSCNFYIINVYYFIMLCCLTFHCPTIICKTFASQWNCRFVLINYRCFPSDFSKYQLGSTSKYCNSCIPDRSLGSLSLLTALGWLHNIAAVPDLEFQAWSRNLHKSLLTTSRPNRSKYSEPFQ